MRPYIHSARDDAVVHERSKRISKKIIQVSSLVFTLAVAGGMAANAGSLSGNEEDAAAPAGSFTSAMEAPAGRNFDAAEHRMRHERFMMRFAGANGSHAMRPNGDRQK